MGQAHNQVARRGRGGHVEGRRPKSKNRLHNLRMGYRYIEISRRPKQDKSGNYPAGVLKAAAP